ncbi:hypothetical protein SH661x_001733 [Planctomicrobium sp. SH661]|uniref:hypothetical protein n=1 Tax=Planctomicrobium sp. SH661 TaxID=3448124 RepID=UPI003F5C7185
MFEFFHSLSDNQTAILACIGAIGASFLLLTISYHGNPANRQATGTSVQKRQEIGVDGQKSNRRAA